MIPTKLKLGMTVTFDPKVFEPPYAPYYDAYKGHRFEVIAFHPLGHVEVTCIDDPSVHVSGHVHDDELVEEGHCPELSEEQAIALVRERFPKAVADQDQYGWYVRAINAEGNLYGFLGRAPTAPEVWKVAARLLQQFPDVPPKS